MAAEENVIFYRPTPTGKKFHASDAPNRLIMGPIGSGKSVACVMELYARAMLQKPHAGVRRTRFAVIRNCFDAKTEILTEKRGWQYFKDLLPDDMVASLHPGDKLVWETPTTHYAAPWDGDLVGLESEGIDFLVTPRHKLYLSKLETRKKVWSPYRFVFAEDAEKLKTGYRIKRDVTPQDGITQFSEKFFEWMGMWFAEGSVTTTKYGRSQTLLVTQTKPEGIEYFRKLCADACIPMTEAHRSQGVNFRLPVTSSFSFLTQLMAECGTAITKKIPLWIKRSPAPHIRAFIEGFINGDGFKRGKNQYSAFTSSSQLAHDLQELAFRCGMVANVSFRDRTKTLVKGFKPTVPEWTVSFITPSKYRPHLKCKGKRNRYRGWYREHYRGTVYCVEVSTHIVYVRRNGLAHWSSQTYPELESTTMKTWTDWIPEQKPNGEPYCKINRQRPPTALLNDWLPDGTRLQMEVHFLALDREEDEKKLLSLELTGAWINEAKEVPKRIWDMAYGRCDRYPPKKMGGCDWHGIIADTNPPDDEHYIYKLAEIERPKGYAFFKQPPAIVPLPKTKKDAPTEYVANQGEFGYEPAENVENHNAGYNYWLRQCAGKDPEWIKVYLMGMYGSVMSGKPVYPEYVDSLHCSKEDLATYNGIPLIIGMDFGLTPAAAFCQLSPRGQFRAIDELCGEDIGIRNFARNVLKPHLMNNYPGIPYSCFADPAGNQRSQSSEVTCLQELMDAGITCQMASTNEFIARREAVVGYLSRLVDGQPGFLLSPKCKVLRKAFMGGYHYRKMKISGSDRFSESPEKNRYSHISDAIQYAALEAENGASGLNPNRGQVTPFRGGFGRRQVVSRSSLGWT